MRQLCVFSIQFPLQNLMERDDVKSGFSFNYSCRGIFVTFMKSSYIYIYIYNKPQTSTRDHYPI
jgi:hypothetical protein